MQGRRWPLWVTNGAWRADALTKYVKTMMELEVKNKIRNKRAESKQSDKEEGRQGETRKRVRSYDELLKANQEMKREVETLKKENKDLMNKLMRRAGGNKAKKQIREMIKSLIKSRESVSESDDDSDSDHGEGSSEPKPSIKDRLGENITEPGERAKKA